MTIRIRQAPATRLEDVAEQLRSAFLVTREAIAVGDSVVLVVDAPDLLGQGSVEDAAVATGLLGLMRAVTFEGGSKGWQVNMVAVDRGAEPPADVIAFAEQSTMLKGQVLNTSAGQIGKVIP